MAKNISPLVKTPKPNLPEQDDQQAMRALKQYGGYIVLAILLALAGYFGWNYWQQHGGRIDSRAMTDFAKIELDQTQLDDLQKSSADAASNQQLMAAKQQLAQDLDNFISQHGNSVYTWQALIQKAALQADANDFKGSAATLAKARELNINDDGLQAIATLRYAEALLADNQPDAAAQALQTPMPAAFDISKNELLGDIALQRGDKAQASKLYQQAWQGLQTRNQNNAVPQDRALLRVKMESLGLTVQQPDPTGGVIVQSEPTQASSNAVAAEPSASSNAASASTPAVTSAAAQP